MGSTRVENEIVRTSAIYVSGDHDQRAPSGSQRELREFAHSLGDSVRPPDFPHFIFGELLDYSPPSSRGHKTESPGQNAGDRLLDLIFRSSGSRSLTCPHDMTKCFQRILLQRLANFLNFGAALADALE